MVSEIHIITDTFYLNLNNWSEHGISNYMMYYFMDDDSKYTKYFDEFDVRNLNYYAQEKKYILTKW